MRALAKKKKATFVLEEQLIDEAKKATAGGHFKSLNAFVQEALADYLRKIRKGDLRKSWVEASQDPLFLSDIAEVERDFAKADKRSLRQK